MTSLGVPEVGLGGRVRRLSSGLPPGALAVGVGLLSASVTTYGFLVLTGRILGPERYAPLSVLWSVVFLFVPATYLPLEQELSRRIAARRAVGVGALPSWRAGRTVVVGLAAGLAALALASSAWTSETIFGGQELVVVASAVAACAFAFNHLVRSSLAGAGSFRRYGWCVGLDSATRLALAAVLALAGVRSVGPFALALGLAPVLPALALTRRTGPHREPGPPDTAAAVAASVAPLVGAQVLAQLLVNGAPLVVALLAGPGDEVAAAQLLATLVVARVPLFFFMAVQSSLLPRLAGLHAVGDRPGFVSLLRRLLSGLAALTVAGAVAAVLVGQPVTRIAFGPEFVLGRQDLFLLAVGACLYMLGVVAAQAVVALSGHLTVAIGWLAGVLAAAVVIVAVDDLLLRVEAGFAAGMGAAVAVQLLAARARLAGWRGSDAPV